MTVSAELAAVCRRVLPNGMRATALRRSWSPAVAVNLWYDVGSRDDPAQRSGFAHLFEHLMFQGSGRVAAGEHFALIQAAGGVLNASTSFDRTNYFQTLPNGGLDLTLWLEADRLGSLPVALSQQNLDNQRDVVKNERRLRYDDVPFGTVGERLHAAAFPPGHPYHHTTIGLIDDLDAASLSDVQAFFDAHYRPSRAVVSVVGDVDPQRALDRVEHFLGAVREPVVATVPRQPTASELPLPTAATQRAAVPVPALHLMFRLPADGIPGCDAAVLAMRTLAGSARSRLHERLVRTEQLAASVSGAVTRLRAGSSVGTIAVRGMTGADPSRLWELTAVELDRLAVYGPTPEEVDAARAMVARAERDRLDSLPGLADELSRWELTAGDASLAPDAPTRWAGVDVAAVAEAAAALAAPRAFRLTTVPQ